ncbi:DNA-3-methyladenine glycosylase II [Methanolinea mesophila]|uniref:DNA-3-methyladenine glycosylase family protein n=1 Tax=Methanolinea mesophila TaxID=547055 RepID=UPI001AE82DFB|nr:DNA-3-methyladenine glycosylase 2 family protein [Methanolinea mesophila]MBP1928796.1 DNA-3-methyladenine glycosylase II [Methanolinea mesophila]
MKKIVTLLPAPPYDFPLSARIFSEGDPAIRSFRDGIFTHAFCLEDRLRVVAEVRPGGSVEDPLLELSIRSPARLAADTVDLVKTRIENILNIRDDLRPFYSEMHEDPIMTELCTRLRGLKSPTTPTVFEALADSIIEQQISLAAARKMEDKLVKEFGASFVLDGEEFFCYPSPGTLAAGTPERFRACGLSTRKGEYIRDTSRLIAEGTLDLEGLREYEDIDVIIGKLMEIRGIGRWTAELTVLRGMHRVEAIPADDLGIRKLISRFYRDGDDITGEEARGIAKRWGRWKGLAAFYLIIAGWSGISPPGHKPL